LGQGKIAGFEVVYIQSGFARMEKCLGYGFSLALNNIRELTTHSKDNVEPIVEARASPSRISKT
jgi:hypothetical protein